MKKLFLFLALIATTQLSAVNYCASSSWGYAGTVTGGGSASPTLVSVPVHLSLHWEAITK